MNRPTDRRILKIILPRFRIQSEILKYLRILKLQRFAVSLIFWVRIFYFAREEFRIVDLNDRQKCVVSGYDCIYFFFVTDETFCMSRISEIVTHCGQREEKGKNMYHLDMTNTK